MTLPPHTCMDDSLSRNDWNGQLVFAFGQVDIDSRIPEEQVVRIPKYSFVKPDKLCDSLPPELWEHGVILVASREDDHPGLLPLQMHILMEFHQKALFPSMMPYAPEPTIQNLLGGMKDPSRNIHQLRNMPFLLRYPVADKLYAQKIGLPVLLVLPGPSARQLEGKLKELAERFLVVCIARSLQFCLDQGVEPDFVVQYDTHSEQKHFYDDIGPLPNTTLVSLSSANIATVAHKFRGVIFRASFNQALLQNAAELRDGSEGSMLACMGLTEALWAPQAYLTGCDCSWPETTSQYYDGTTVNGTEAGPAASGTGPARNRLTSRGTEFGLLNRAGEPVLTTIWYIAPAARAASFARVIGKTTGTTFQLLSPSTILTEKEFPLTQPSALLDAPPIDRTAFLEQVDRALNTPEPIDLPLTYQYFAERLKIVRSLETHFRIRRDNPEYDFRLRSALVSLTRNTRRISRRHPETDAQALYLLTAWRKALDFAVKVSRAHLLARSHGPLPLLCLAEEQSSILEKAHPIFPETLLKAVSIHSNLNPPKETTDNSMADVAIDSLLQRHRLLLLTPAVLDRHNYLFEQMDPDCFLVLPIPQ